MLDEPHLRAKEEFSLEPIQLLPLLLLLLVWHFIVDARVLGTGAKMAFHVL